MRSTAYSLQGPVANRLSVARLSAQHIAIDSAARKTKSCRVNRNSRASIRAQVLNLVRDLHNHKHM